MPHDLLQLSPVIDSSVTDLEPCGCLPATEQICPELPAYLQDRVEWPFASSESTESTRAWLSQADFAELG